jgi:hypothetical protein
MLFARSLDRSSPSRAGPLDRCNVDTVAARIAQRTQDSLFRSSWDAVNKKHHQTCQFYHFFSLPCEKNHAETIHLPLKPRDRRQNRVSAMQQKPDRGEMNLLQCLLQDVTPQPTENQLNSAELR